MRISAHTVRSRRSSILVGIIAALSAQMAIGQVGQPGFPRWFESVEVSRPVIGGIGAVTLRGTWNDTCVPDAISHTLTGNRVQLEVTQPGIDVACGDALTPWSLTEEFGPGTDPQFNVYGSLVSVNPANRTERELLAGPDLLAQIEPPRPADFQGLGNGQGRAYLSRAADVSADGRVVTGTMELAPNVNAFITSEAFAWAPETGRFNLGVLPGGIPGGSRANGISPDGNHIVGVSNSGSFGGRDSFQWTLGGGIESLPTITSVASSRATATSANGQVVVGSEQPLTPGAPGSPRSLAYRWTIEDGPMDLGRVFDTGYAESTDVSADGRIVVGNSGPSGFLDPENRTRFEPFRWTSETGIVGLGHLEIAEPLQWQPIFAPTNFSTAANAISADGQTVVGDSSVAIEADILCGSSELECGSVTRAYRWTRESGMVDLGTLEIDGAATAGYSAVSATQNGDVIVGNLSAVFADGPSPRFRTLGFIWDEVRGMRLLEDVLELEYGVNLEGWELGEVAAISDDGSTIVGTGINSLGEQEAWRMVLGRDFVAGDVDFDGDVDNDDLREISGNVGLGEGDVSAFWASGDFDGDGVVTELDLAVAQANATTTISIAGDTNRDGTVDSTDLGLLLNNFGDVGSFSWEGGDFNGDEMVDSTDLGLLLNNFNSASSSSVAVPEPSPLVLLLVSSLVLFGRRRKRG